MISREEKKIDERPDMLVLMSEQPWRRNRLSEIRNKWRCRRMSVFDLDDIKYAVPRYGLP